MSAQAFYNYRRIVLLGTPGGTSMSKDPADLPGRFIARPVQSQVLFMRILPATAGNAGSPRCEQSGSSAIIWLRGHPYSPVWEKPTSLPCHCHSHMCF